MSEDHINQWWQDAVFYHIYPPGFCGALSRNDLHSEPVERLDKVRGWLPHLLDLGVNALYLGPLFESSYHGYDTADYTRVDRRLGSKDALARLCRDLHGRGIRVIFDAVFNHVGRDFWAFRDVLEKGRGSEYCSWFAGLQFGGSSPCGDPFSYQGWVGNFDLVKLDLTNPAVKAHLFDALRDWVREFEIDGLRLDAADCLNHQFLRELRQFTSELKPDFWLMGEIVGGDYRSLANPDMLHSVTNYECYKGLYSSLVDKNYFEIAWSLNRQFGTDGLYRGLDLYNFTDNHDVDRVASSLGDPALLYPLYCLLFTMPGVPSIYYGSEWGITGKRTEYDDSALRPSLELAEISATAPQPDLPGVIRRLSEIRRSFRVFRYGGYAQLLVGHQQFAFLRSCNEERVIVALNAAPQAVSLEIPVSLPDSKFADLLNPGDVFEVKSGMLTLSSVPPRWARVLKPC